MDSFQLPQTREELWPASALSSNYMGMHQFSEGGGGGGGDGFGHAAQAALEPPIMTSPAWTPDGSRLAASPVTQAGRIPTAASDLLFPQSFALAESPASLSLDPNPFFPSSVVSLQNSTIPRSLNPSSYPVKRPRSYSHNVSSMAGEVIQRSRHLSHSPTDRDFQLSTKVAEAIHDLPELKSATSSPSHKKRSHSSLNDLTDYPRRRAIIACEICRSRKSKCDGAKPKCKLCTELKADCVYREPGIKLDAGDKIILERLSRIESLLENRSTPALSTITSSPVNTASPGEDNNTLANIRASVNGLGTWASTSSQNVSNMPKSHTTPALNLLSWPKIRSLVSKKWDPSAIVQQELQRVPLDLSSTQSLDFVNANFFIREFFESVNIWYACVSPFKWNLYYQAARSRNFNPCTESCLVLLVIALGAASRGGSISRLPERVEPPGMQFFAAAWAMLPSLMLRTDVLTTQCQMLTAAYLFYIVRPLEAWNMLVSISLKLQLLVTVNLSPSDKKLCERIYWNTLLFESDLLAEMELPHSGIVQLEELFGLPSPFDFEGEPPVSSDYLYYFLAEIELRRLLNRVSNSIYSISSPITNTAALEPIVSELDSQLMRWYNGLPNPCQFDHRTGRNPNATPVQTVLRLRYFACRTIIYRPYVLAVLINESAFLDPPVENGCRKCLEACIRQVENITAHHAGHLPYIFQGALSIVSQTLLVMGATLSTSLSALLPAQPQMNAIINDVVDEVERYAHLAPSLRLSADILREADNRRRLELTAPMLTSGS